MNVNSATRRPGEGLVASSIHSRDSAAVAIASGDRKRVEEQMKIVLSKCGVASDTSELITRSWSTAATRRRDITSELGGLLTARTLLGEAETRIRKAIDAAELQCAQPEHRGSPELASRLEDLQLQLGENLSDADDLQDLIDDARTRLAAARQEASRIERLVFAVKPSQPRAG